MLCACDPSSVPDSARITLPAAPADLAACFKRSFPDIPQRSLTKADVMRIIGQAAVLDAVKSRCGDRAVAWIESVRATYAKAPPAS